MGVSRHVVLADTEEEAMRTANRAFRLFERSFDYLWVTGALPVPPVVPANSFEEWHAVGGAFAGMPEGRSVTSPNPRRRPASPTCARSSPLAT